MQTREAGERSRTDSVKVENTGANDVNVNAKDLSLPRNRSMLGLSRGSAGKHRMAVNAAGIELFICDRAQLAAESQVIPSISRADPRVIV